MDKLQIRTKRCLMAPKTEQYAMEMYEKFKDADDVDNIGIVSSRTELIIDPSDYSLEFVFNKDLYDNIKISKDNLNKQDGIRFGEFHARPGESFNGCRIGLDGQFDLYVEFDAFNKDMVETFLKCWFKRDIYMLEFAMKTPRGEAEQAPDLNFEHRDDMLGLQRTEC